MPILHLDDIDLYYEIVGEGEPLLFIHGLGSSTRDWEEQLSFFSKHYKVIVFDVRGHGRSSKPSGPYSISRFATDTKNLLAGLGIASVHVIGISMGGMIAFQLAVSHPQLVKSLIIVNSTPEFVVRSFKLRMQVFIRFFIVRLLGMRRLGKILSKKLFPSPEHEKLRTVFAGRWAENDARAYREAMQAIVGWSVMDRVEAIHCPTLVIASSEDYTPLAVKKAYVERMVKARLVVIDDARHAVPVERPGQFNTVLATFLEEQGR